MNLIIIKHLLSSFLTFDDKINITKATNYNFFNYYNICDKNYIFKNIYEIFDDEVYDQYNDFIFDTEWDIRNKMVEEWDDEDLDNDYIIRHKNIPFISRYVREFIEHMENKNIYIPFNKNENIMEDEHWNLIDYVVDDIVENECDFIYFCQKCGLYGHHEEHENCLLWTETYYNATNKSEVNYTLNTITEKIIYRIERENKENKLQVKNTLNSIIYKIEQENKRKKQPKINCINCNKCLSSSKCQFNKCGNCCRCGYHTKK